jgi:hypothetical protein
MVFDEAHLFHNKQRRGPSQADILPETRLIGVFLASSNVSWGHISSFGDSAINRNVASNGPINFAPLTC